MCVSFVERDLLAFVSDVDGHDLKNISCVSVPVCFDYSEWVDGAFVIVNINMMEQDSTDYCYIVFNSYILHPISVLRA